MITSFENTLFLFSRRDAEVAQGAQSEIKGSCHFLRSNNPISSRTARDAENRLNTSFLPLAFQFSRRVVKGVVTF